VMRLDNPELVPQHKQPGMLFWSASLVVNNEFGVRWRHWKPSTLLTANRTCRENVRMWVLCGWEGGLCVSIACRYRSECAACCKPQDKRTEVPCAFANGCSALFKNPFTVSWRLTQIAQQPAVHTNQPTSIASI